MFSSDPELVAAVHSLLQLATWESNPDTDEIRWTSGRSDIYAKPADQIETVSAWLELVHQQDRERLALAMRHAVETESGFHEQFRVQGNSGAFFWIFGSGQVVRRPDGGQRLLGVNMDVTNWAEALAASDARFQATFEQAAVGIAHVGIDGKWLAVNRRFCEMLGYTKEAMLKLAFGDITHPSDLDADWELHRELLRDERQTYSLVKRYFARDGRVVWANLTVSLVRKNDGSPHYFISVIEDITARKQIEDERDQLIANLDRRVKERTAELEYLSFTDSLTGIANRRSFDDRLHAEWNRAVRSGEPVSVLLIDIDYFKQLNDTLGHAAADRVLILVATEMTKVFHRSVDMAARYGGDEFAILLPGTNPEGALTVANQIQAAIRWLDLPHPASTVSSIVTISVGVATVWPSKKGSSHSLMVSVDRALYSAKRSGKNCISLAPVGGAPSEFA